MIRLFLASAVALLIFLPGETQSGCRHVAVQQQAVVAYHPAYTPYYYSVGANLQTQASEERIAALVIQKLQAKQQTAPAPQTLPLTAQADRWANTKQVCAGCHTTGADAMAHVNMVDFSSLTCEQKLSAIRNMVEGKMPPPESGKKVTPEQLGQLIGEFSGANNVTQP